MANIIDKINNYRKPIPSTPEDRAKSLKELQDETELLEQQADYAEARELSLVRAKKAKSRIKATRSYPNIKPSHILIGSVLLVIIVLIIMGGC